jgi:2-amino-4-hydroxy-6-hydroxymethyldihydropteridine diphosphokinase
MNLLVVIGGNLGNKLENIRITCDLLHQKLGEIIQKSPIYETKAWGVTDQPDFLNQALHIKSHFSPFEALNICQEIETKFLKREKKRFWGERTMDIDIIYYENWQILTKNLIIPHPYRTQRKFVLEPLADICPDFVDIITQKTIKIMNEELL